ncbi:YcdB/YcdC domain-containing protein [Brevibacillus sp. B_LB10_24]|uniref:YcdB/YcdC domain-containing protein n=1 Tax=Brevibacillus sp. B_LB10_24 TaxID=3380645 RepID=UPI0038BCEAF4
MDVDKEFRQAVRGASKAAVKDVRFTPELEKKILDQAAKRSGRSYRKVYMATAAVACLAVGFSLWNPTTSGLQDQLQQSAAALSEQKANATLQKALAPLLKAIPELSSYQIEIKGTTGNMISAVLLKKDGVYAKAAVNKDTGELEVFKWFAERGSENEPTEQMAREKAAAFLKAYLGENSGQYQEVAAGEIVRPHNGFLDLDAKGIYVTYKQVNNGKAVPFTDISVWVDGQGRIVSYGQVNKSEQTMLTKLQEVLPELRTDAVLANKEAGAAGFSLALANADEQGSTVFIGTEGKGNVLRSYNVENSRDQDERVEWAPKSVAIERANRFLQSVLGDDWKNYRETGTSTITDYMRYYNGIPVLEDTLHVAVDKEGRVRQYSKRADTYDLSALPNQATAVSKQVAEAELAKNMKLRYIEHAVIKRDPQSQKAVEVRPMLDYTPAVGFSQMGEPRSLYWYIDAATGKIQYGTGSNGFAYDQLATHEPISLNGGKSNQVVIVKTKEEAASLLAKEMGVDVRDLPFSEHVEENGLRSKQKMFLWQSKEGKRIGVAVDAGTGQVKEISVPRANAKNTVSEQDAFKEAVRLLEKYVDPGVTEVQVSQIIRSGEANPVSSGSWEFEFIKSHDGVPVLEQYPIEAYIVEVDPSTGKAIGFVNRTELREQAALPDKSRVVPVEKAVQEYLAHLPLQLAYTIKGVEGAGQGIPKLIYVPMGDKAYADKTINIDAITGNAVIQ